MSTEELSQTFSLMKDLASQADVLRKLDQAVKAGRSIDPALQMELGILRSLLTEIQIQGTIQSVLDFLYDFKRQA